MTNPAQAQAQPQGQWHPDPSNPAQLRWWDGAAWTEHVHPVSQLAPKSPGLGMRMALPVGRSGWAIASGYLGLVSITLIAAPFAVITGILGIREIKRRDDLHGMGRAIFGIVMGSLVMAGIAAVLVTGGMS